LVPGRTACLKCIYPEPPGGPQPTCETEGVLATVTSAIAALQVADALKILARGVDGISTRLVTLDAWTGEVRRVADPARDPDCPCCARPLSFPHLDGAPSAPISLCGRNAWQIHERFRPINLDELAGRLSAVAAVRSNQFALRVTLDAYELTVFPDGRAIVKGTTTSGLRAASTHAMSASERPLVSPSFHPFSNRHALPE